jgi:hypothetical protein
MMGGSNGAAPAPVAHRRKPHLPATAATVATVATVAMVAPGATEGRNPDRIAA